MNMKNQRGFTLIEMMVVMAIVSILAGVAIPNFAQFISNTHTRADARNFFSACNLAKVTAVKENKKVLIRISIVGNGSYFTFVDSNSNFQYDNGERKIQTVSLTKPSSLSHSETKGIDQTVFGWTGSGLAIHDQGNTGIDVAHVIIKNDERSYKVEIKSTGYIKISNN